MFDKFLETLLGYGPQGLIIAVLLYAIYKMVERYDAAVAKLDEQVKGRLNDALEFQRSLQANTQVILKSVDQQTALNQVIGALTDAHRATAGAVQELVRRKNGG